MTSAADREWYVAARPAYIALCETVEERVNSLARELLIVVETHSRAKTVLSFVKKAAARGYAQPQVEIADLAGVRVTMISRRHRDLLVDAIVAAYPGSAPEPHQPELTELGYRAVHVTIEQLCPDGVVRRCEIQLRTAGEDAWDRISHELLYKPGLELPPAVTRNLYLLQALAEMMDNESETGMTVMVEHPLYPASRLLAYAEREFYARVQHEFSSELSLEVLRVVVPLVGNIEDYSRTLEAFATSNDPKLTQVLYSHAEDPVNILLSQPEAIVLFELASRDEHRLRDAWDRILDPEWLEPIFDAWGATV